MSSQGSLNMDEGGSMKKTQPDTADFEDGDRGHKPQNAGSPRKLKRAKKQILPRASRKKTALLSPGL